MSNQTLDAYLQRLWTKPKEVQYPDAKIIQAAMNKGHAQRAEVLGQWINTVKKHIFLAANKCCGHSQKGRSRLPWAKTQTCR